MTGGRARRWGLLIAAAAILAVLWIILRSSSVPAPNAASHEPDRTEAQAEDERSAPIAEPPPLPRGSARIRGRLFLHDGTPASRGVRISLAQNEHLDFAPEIGTACNCPDCEDVYLEQICPDAIPRLAGIMDRIAHERRAQAETETDGSGRFSFDELSADTYAVWAEADSISAALGGITLAEREEKNIELRSDELGSIRGFVNDKVSGENIAGAKVAAMDLALGTIREAHGGPDGKFEIRGLRRGARYYVQAKAPGYGPGGHLPARTGDTLKLELPHLALIKGVVLDHKRPVDGITVETDADEKTFVTDKDGRFTIDHLAEGAVTIFAANEDKSRGTSVSIQAVPGLNEVVLEMDRLCDLEVHVTYPDGQAAEDALVDVTRDGNFKDRGGSGELTDEKGVAHFEWLEPGESFLHIEDEIERAPITLCKDADRRHEVTTLVIGKEPGIMGIVTGEDHEPLDKVSVRVEPKQSEEEEGGGRERQAFTHESGRYRIPGVGGGRWKVSAEAGGFKTKTIEISRTSHEPDSTVDIVLERGGVIRGHVVDRSKVPLAGWTVTGGGGGIATRSKADGAFELGGLDFNVEYTLSAQSEGALGDGPLGHPMRRMLSTDAVTAKAGDEHVVLTALEDEPPKETAAPPDEDGRIAGRVIDAATKEPVRGARVLLDGPLDPARNAWPRVGAPSGAQGMPASIQPTFQRQFHEPRETTASGGFTIEHLSAGEYALAVHDEEHLTSRRTVTVKAGGGGDLVVIELERGVEITGTVHVAGGGEDAVSVMCIPADRFANHITQSTSLDEGGTFRCRVPKPGAYYVETTLHDPRWHAETQIETELVVKVDVPEQGLSDVSISVPTGRASVVVTVPPPGADARFPHEDLMLTSNAAILPEDRRMSHLSEGIYYKTRGQVGAGTVRIDHVAPGKLTLFVDSFFGESGWARTVEVPPSGVVKVVLKPEESSKRPLLGTP